MSRWAYVRGTITITPLGRTQAEKRYILDSVLDHLPRVTGSEGDMNVYVIQKNGHNCSYSCDEFGEHSNNLIGSYGQKTNRGWLNTQSQYIIIVDGSLRDRCFEDTKREFMKWICRLAKRVKVDTALVDISGCNENWEEANLLIREDSRFFDMFECPSWSIAAEPNDVAWCEYLMWDPVKDSQYPLALAYKYYNDKDVDEEFEHRIKYSRGEYTCEK